MNTTSSAPRRTLRGVIAAIPTPLDDTGPDHPRMIALARHLLDSGCDGLNVLGTTGEANSLSVAERVAIMSAFAQAALPMHRLMVGTGATAVTDAVTLSRHAASLGFAGILVIPPFFYKDVTDAGIVAYLRRIVDSTADTQTPVYLYNFPALSGVPYAPALVKTLLEEFGPRIAGLKDSSGNLAYAIEIAALSKTLDVFPSSEAHLLAARSGPFAGCISATVNVSSRDAGKAFTDGDEAALARAIETRKIFDGLPLIPGIKYLLSVIHADPRLAVVRPPLVAVSSHEAQTIRARFGAI